MFLVDSILGSICFVLAFLNTVMDPISVKEKQRNPQKQYRLAHIHTYKQSALFALQCILGNRQNGFSNLGHIWRYSCIITFTLPFQDRENKKKEKQRQTENDYDTELFCLDWLLMMQGSSVWIFVGSRTSDDLLNCPKSLTVS